MVVREDDPRVPLCGFAKLEGRDSLEGFEFVAKKYEIWLGRRSKSSNLDIVLGDNMNISRQHAKIAYNFERGAWELSVFGKNGVTCRGALHDPSSPPFALESRDFIQIGDKSFYFLLPKRPQQRHRGHEAEEQLEPLKRQRVHNNGAGGPPPVFPRSASGTSEGDPEPRSAAPSPDASPAPDSRSGAWPAYHAEEAL